MKNYILPLIALLCSLNVLANDENHISLGAYVDNQNKEIPAEATNLLLNRIQKAIAAGGFGDNEGVDRFAIVAKCDVLSKDIAPTTPPRVSQKLEISLLVVDIIENKIYDSCELLVSGIGTNETKAFSAAFQKVSAQNKNIKEMLERAKVKIVDYYTNSCPEIITTSKTLASIGEFDKAIFTLMSVPNVCADCFNQCQSLATEFYQQKIDAESSRLLEQAKSKWAASKSTTSAKEVADIIGRIDPHSTNFSEVEVFRNSVSAKLAADAQRQWEFEMKKYDDNQQFKRSVVEACRAVGVTFAKNFQIPQINLLKRF